MFLYVVSLEIQLLRSLGDPINRLNIPQPHNLVPVPIQDLDVQRHLSWSVLSVFSELKLDVIVRFVYLVELLIINVVYTFFS